ncbi:MAG: polysaccharide deacetylase family protein [Actinobacteria bacterium]|nr:polysaccharide deacetylase family protein [Actinomycetota bacterium]
MNLARFLIESRGPVNLAQRIPTLFARFGLTDEKIKRRLDELVEISQRHGASPTLAVTANILVRHPALIKELQSRGVELAIHGLVHTDYSSLSFEKQIDHLSRAQQVFMDNGVEYFGFRCPYLRYNQDTWNAVDRLGFKWESSDVIAWDVLDELEVSQSHKRAYEKLIALYSARLCKEAPALPRRIGNFIEIPVSIPDDEAVVDRLGITDPESIADLWLNIFNESYKRGHLFTIQLHHERMPFFRMALDRVLGETHRMHPGVWMPKLKDIADWFFEKERVKVVVSRCESGYRVNVDGSQKVTLLLKNGSTTLVNEAWFKDYRLVKSGDFVVLGNKRPCVGVGRRVDESTREFLRSQGFVVEEADDKGDYSVYLTSCTWETRERALEVIERAKTPIIRVWHWPGGTRSAVTVTGDIDSVTLIDFASRIFEV